MGDTSKTVDTAAAGNAKATRGVAREARNIRKICEDHGEALSPEAHTKLLEVGQIDEPLLKGLRDQFKDLARAYNKEKYSFLNSLKGLISGGENHAGDKAHGGIVGACNKLNSAAKEEKSL